VDEGIGRLTALSDSLTVVSNKASTKLAIRFVCSNLPNVKEEQKPSSGRGVHTFWPAVDIASALIASQQRAQGSGSELSAVVLGHTRG
jgi:hypothetical protein